MEVRGKTFNGKLDFISGGNKLKWDNGSEWLKQKGFNGYWMKVGREKEAKYIIEDDHVQMIELDSTVTFNRDGFDCFIDILGGTWNGKFVKDRLIWDNGSAWVRDVEWEEGEDDTIEEKDKKFAARIKKEHESKKRAEKHKLAVEQLKEALSNVPELKALPPPPMQISAHIIGSTSICHEIAAQTHVWEAAQEAQARSAPSSPLKGRTASLPSPSRNAAPSPGSPERFSSVGSPTAYRLPAPPGADVEAMPSSPWRGPSLREVPTWIRVEGSALQVCQNPEYVNVQDKAWL